MEKPTTHELMKLNELIRTEAVELQKLAPVLPMIGDAELREHLEGCLNTGKAHLKALVGFCRENGVVH